MLSPKIPSTESEQKEEDLSADFIAQDNIQIEKKSLNTGAYGIIYAGFWSERAVAIKKLKTGRLTKNNIESFKKEIQLSTQLKHPNVVTTYGYTSFEHPYNLGMIMERMSFSLFDFIVEKNKKPLGSSDLTHSIMYQVFNGINYIHSQGIIHRDIKPENFLMSYDYEEVKIKLCDFGYAVKINDKFIDPNRSGTKAYHAPEVIKDKLYGYKSDLFAAGCVFQSTITQCNCYDSDYPGSDSNILAGNREPLPSDTNPLFRQIIEECSREVPENRPTAEEVVNRLKLC